MDIVIDTVGQPELSTKDQLVESESDEETQDTGGDDLLNLFDVDSLQVEKTQQKWKKKHTSGKDFDLDKFEADMGWTTKYTKPRKDLLIPRMIEEVNPLDKILAKTVIKPGFEQLECVPSYAESKRRLRAQRRKEREKTKGKQWFNLPAPEITDEIKHDLEVIQMRSVLDPKHFYKKNDLKAIPKYFQIGKVIDSPVDYYSGRLTNKERKRTIVEELMADAEFSKYNKRKYKEIIDEKKKTHLKAHKHAKKLKKGKKR